MGKEDFTGAQRLGTYIPSSLCPFVGQSLSGGLSGPEDVASSHTPELTGLAGWHFGDESET